MKRIAIIGAGPAGLMAAQAALECGASVTIYDAMPSAARKFLMAGKSGLNISHDEDRSDFLNRYTAPDRRLVNIISAFGPSDIREWMDGFDEPSFVGTSGRIFPVAMKASPLLRKWLRHLSGQGAKLETRNRWTGWNSGGELTFDTPDGLKHVQTDTTVLALGGKSWSRLGATGEWADILVGRNVALEPFEPSNCGFEVGWTQHLLERHEGAPIKNVRLEAGGESSRGDVVITGRGVESGAIYPLAAGLREELSLKGAAILQMDLAPDVTDDTLAKRFASANKKDSMSNKLRKAGRLDKAKIALVNEVVHGRAPSGDAELVRLIKALPLKLTGTVPIDEAISTAGGVSWDALNDSLMLKSVPGTFCAGEMVAWDAPTGGYLLTACLAMGRAAGRAAAEYIA